MPIVSEHPRTIDIIKKLSDECDFELETFINQYSERRRAYSASRQARQTQMPERLNEDREMSCGELLALLEAREVAAEEMRLELQAMNRELTLLSRELRRARRRALELSEEDDQPDFDSARPIHSTASVPSAPSMQEYVDRARQFQLPAWLGPWLRGFLPNSA